MDSGDVIRTQARTVSKGGTSSPAETLNRRYFTCGLVRWLVRLAVSNRALQLFGCGSVVFCSYDGLDITPNVKISLDLDL